MRRVILLAMLLIFAAFDASAVQTKKFYSPEDLAKMNGKIPATNGDNTTNVTRVDMVANINIATGNVNSTGDASLSIDGDELAKAIQARLDKNETLHNVTVKINVTINSINAGHDVISDIRSINNFEIGETHAGGNVSVGNVIAQNVNAGDVYTGKTTKP